MFRCNHGIAEHYGKNRQQQAEYTIQAVISLVGWLKLVNFCFSFVTGDISCETRE